LAERDEAMRLLLVNGLAMLFGVARVHVAQLTEGYMTDRIVLPSINFQPLVDNWMQEEPESEDV
jgi:preprotein translocase subunit SecB